MLVVRVPGEEPLTTVQILGHVIVDVPECRAVVGVIRASMVRVAGLDPVELQQHFSVELRWYLFLSQITAAFLSQVPAKFIWQSNPSGISTATEQYQ